MHERVAHIKHKMPLYSWRKLRLFFLIAWEMLKNRCICVCRSQNVCPFALSDQMPNFPTVHVTTLTQTAIPFVVKNSKTFFLFHWSPFLKISTTLGSCTLKSADLSVHMNDLCISTRRLLTPYTLYSTWHSMLAIYCESQAHCIAVQALYTTAIGSIVPSGWPVLKAHTKWLSGHY